MAKTDNLTDFLTNIADAIRTVEGSTNAINPQDFEAKITALKLSVQTADANATAADILSGKTAWVKGTKISGSIGTKDATTIIPGTSDQTIASGVYLAGAQTIKGDSNLIAGNIKSGTSIFGVTGTYEGSGGGSSGGSASFTTGTITGTKRMSAPGTYDYTYDLSVIPNLDSANIIVLKYRYTASSHMGLVSLHRENANDAFSIARGYIMATDMTIISNILKLSEADDAAGFGIDLTSCIYYAK